MIEFTIDDPPTFPGRTRSGKALKGRVLQAFAKQVDAERETNQALDQLIVALRRYTKRTDPPEALSALEMRGAFTSEHEVVH